MEWNWLSGNNTTPFLLSESTGDSEEVKIDVHHDHEEEDGAAMDEQEGVSFRFNDEDHEVVVVDDEDDAQSCSYDHSSYINNRYGGSKYDQSQRLIYDGDDDDDGDVVDEEDEYDDKNQCQTKVMDSSKQQWRSQKFCVRDPSNQSEIDRKFWETCLAS
ncbi:hypothetical protein HanRHA438_Chr11g0510191 [Helianthus annuus]|nr:hypothetical protein HanIR_Chr11g0535721 [Helianthus annuus]KAJ0871254.1 hypothetical protein HanRHA438_Chr11g0510191 [Helianthus annuus]